jgi:hypothetical protein
MHTTLRAVFGYTAMALLFSACTGNVHVRPEIEPQTIGDFRLAARVVFDGNRDYLPRVLQDSPVGNDGITVEYRYDVSHKNVDMDAIALFNPLSLVGFPSGSNQLTLLAELKILRKGELLKGYRAICAVEQQTGLWSFRTLTEMRREGLLALRNNIESQLIQDRTYIETLALAH